MTRLFPANRATVGRGPRLHCNGSRPIPNHIDLARAKFVNQSWQGPFAGTQHSQVPGAVENDNRAIRLGSRRRCHIKNRFRTTEEIAHTPLIGAAVYFSPEFSLALRSRRNADARAGESIQDDRHGINGTVLVACLKAREQFIHRRIASGA